MKQADMPINGQHLLLLNILLIAFVSLIGLKFGFLLGLSFILLAVLSFGSFIYLLNKPHFILMLAVYGTYMGSWGKLFSDNKLPLSMFQMFLFFGFFVYFIYKLKRCDLTIRFYRQYRWIALFIGLLLLSSLYSYARGDAIYNTLSLGTLALFTCLVADSFHRESIYKWFFRILLVICIPLSLYMVYHFSLNPQYVFINALIGGSKIFGRQVGSGADPNEFGILLVFPLLYILSVLFIKTKSLYQFIVATPVHFAMFVIILVYLLTSYSRSSCLSLFVGLLLIVIFSRLTIKFTLLSVLLTLAVMIFSRNSLFLQSILNRFTSITNVSSNASNISRVVLADAGLKMFENSYFLGFGYRSFRPLAHAYFDPTKTMGVIAPHNISIALLADVGILGFILFYGMFFSFFREGVKLFRSPGIDVNLKIYILTFLSYLISLLTFYQFYPGGLHNNLMWFCFGAILSIKAILTNKKMLKQDDEPTRAILCSE